MTDENKKNCAVLLVNLGTPAAPEPGAIRQFLKDFLSDERVIDLPRWLWLPLLNGVILPLRSRKIAANYRSIWMPEGSPLMVYSADLSDGLQRQMPAGVGVRLAMRYGSPSIGDELGKLQQDGYQKILIVPMYPQYSATTTASVFDAVYEYYRNRPILPELRFVNQYFDDPLWVNAIAGRIREYWRQHGRAELLLFSLHGIPRRYSEQGDPYQKQCESSTAAIVESLELNDREYRLTYQSRVGREEWLQPYTDKTLEQLPSEGIKRVQVICPGFSVDCLETLDEIAVEDRDIFTAAGGESLEYIPALNAGEDHIELFTKLVTRHIRGWLDG